ncbi:MAG TPA: hypothetical protein VGE01_01195 [Fimbriimonas sp.]
MREDFSELELPQEAIVAYPPDRDALFAYLRARTTDKMLRAIAECDYGEDAIEHGKELKRIREGRNLEQPIGWIPNEVLSLFRWSEFDTEKVLRDPTEFHLARAFACCALTLIPDEIENRDLFEPDSLLPLVESIPILGHEYRAPLLSLATHALRELKPWDEPYLFYGLGLLSAVVEGPHEEELLDRLGRWFVAAHEEILPWHSDRSYSDARTFLDLRFISIQQNRWRNLAAGLRERVPGESPLQPLLELLSQGKTFRQKVEDARDVARVGVHVGPSIVKMLWRVFRGKPPF